MTHSKYEYEAQLARVLEIEGLLLLSRERGDSAPALVKRLLAEKTAALAAAFAQEPAHEPEACECAAAAEAAADAEAEAEAEAAEFEEREMAVAVKEPEPVKEPQPKVTVAEQIARKQARRMAGAIKLVDRFRFRRELFENSDEEMNRALEMIDSMADADEAREFLLNDLCWDATEPTVADFLQIVDNHFGK